VEQQCEPSGCTHFTGRDQDPHRTWDTTRSRSGFGLCQDRYDFLFSLKPNFPALFSRNKLPSRMQRLTICTLRWPVYFMIDRSDAPAIAALFARPARSEWPAYFPGSRPARIASFLTMRARSMLDNCPLAYAGQGHAGFGDVAAHQSCCAAFRWRRRSARVWPRPWRAPGHRDGGFAPADRRRTHRQGAHR
jgi:hypothetical protein